MVKEYKQIVNGNGLCSTYSLIYVKMPLVYKKMNNGNVYRAIRLATEVYIS